MHAHGGVLDWDHPNPSNKANRVQQKTKLWKSPSLEAFVLWLLYGPSHRDTKHIKEALHSGMKEFASLQLLSHRGVSTDNM
jgi:hypothetical protein